MAFGQPPSDHHQGDPFSPQIPAAGISQLECALGWPGVLETDYGFLSPRDLIK